MQPETDKEGANTQCTQHWEWEEVEARLVAQAVVEAALPTPKAAQGQLHQEAYHTAELEI